MREHWQYLKFLLKHKWFVFQECCRLGIPWRGLVHDLSKFSPAEWGPYVDYFYGGPWPDRLPTDFRYQFGDQYTKGWVQRRFDAAWLTHIHRNPHHWQHYVLLEDSGAVKVLEMPRPHRLEMIADWWGAGRALGGKPPAGADRYAELRAWYVANKDKMQLGLRTREMVEAAIGYGQPQDFTRRYSIKAYIR